MKTSNSNSNSKIDLEDGRSRSNEVGVERYAKKDNTLERNGKLAFCFFGLLGSYIVWGLVQENLMTQEYKMGKFKSSAFCVFGNRFFALFISLGIVMYQRYTSTKPQKEAPFHYYFPASLSNTISSQAQYEALKYISFPAQVLSKSCKIIPVMLVGIFLNQKTYPWSEYAEALMITAGVATFTLTEKAAPGNSQSDSYFGISLLLLYLFCDSFTSQWQSKVYKKYSVDQYQMMLGVNAWSMVFTGLTMLYKGDFFSSLAFLLSDQTALLHMMILSITSATGQLFIYYTIKEFGPVIFTIMMTARQLLSMILSIVLYGHSLQALGWCSSVFVFMVVFNRIYRKGTD